MATIRDRYVLDIDTKGATTALTGLKGALGGLTAALSVGAVVNFGKTLIDASNQITQYENKLLAAGIAQQDLAKTFETLRGVAAANRTEFGATVDLFSKLQASSSSLGLTQEGVVESLTNFQIALKAAGADAATADAAIYQFGQAMASGTLQGDEFRSLMEAMGTSMAKVASDAGMTSAELKAMASSGELTAPVFLKMLNASTSLQASFEAMQPTIAELETALSTAFVDAAAELSDVTGLTDAYAGSLEGLTRTLQEIAGTTPAIFDEDSVTILEKARDGTYSYSAALKELNYDLENFQGLMNLFTGNMVFEEDQVRLDALRAAIAELKLLQEESKKAAEAAAAEAEARKAALGPLEEVIARTKEYANANAESTSKLDGLIAQQEQVKEDIDALNAALGTGAEQYVNLNAEIAAAEERHAALGIEIEKVRQQTEGMTLGNYFADLIANSEEAVQRTELAKYALEDLDLALKNGAISQEVYNVALETVNSSLGIAAEQTQTYADYWKNLQETIAQTTLDQGLDALGMSLNEAGYSTLAYGDYLKNLQSTVEETLAMDGFKQQALTDLKAQLDAGTMSIQEYDAYMRAMGETTRSVADQQKRLADTVDDFKSSAGDRLQREKDQAELQGLTGLRRELRGIELEEQRLAESAKKRIAEQFPDGVNSQQQIQAIKEIDRAMKESIQSRSELAEEIYNQQRTFSYGWQKAFEEYADDAGNAAKTAQKVFQQTTRGMEDAIVGFAKTGKFEWKSFVADIAETILRANVQKLIAGLFGGAMPGGNQGYGNQGQSSGGGFLGDLFGGFFATGGMIPPGRFGIVGESGPEYVSGPANVTPIGSTQVTYNINAVDAASFRQLVARDPAFIHAVAQQGARTIPGSRR